MCRLYGVSRSGYYAWCHRQPSQRALDNEKLLKQIESLYWKSDESYGSPRVHGVLKNQGERINRKRIERLMRENGIRARSSRIYRANPGTHAFFATFDNEILERLATRPDRIWVGDVTYLWINSQWRYLAMILDKYSRKIVGWSLSKRRNVDLTLNVFKRAARRRLIQPGLYFHSDRGSEYVATKYQNWLKDNGIIQSMNRKWQMNDNAEMESFFHQFKAERIHRNEFVTEKELRAVVIEYVGFYNQRRIHSSLAYQTPDAYEVSLN